MEYTKDTKISENKTHGVLRDKLIKGLRKSIVIKDNNVDEELLRKKILDDIKKGELKAIPV
ncbi:MAG: hypothetical protein PHH54_06775 [Candidatus Nanoarchaeia archaeon]|nr:hypothetical protein [Candidatus Nanoarchaeia archaeon]MDD5741659.1 hypothetical protein [Candidatus Nanoarchaeia archaeon]